MSDIIIHSKTKSDYSEKYSDHVLEQYKLYLEMADRISARRQTANTFFVSLNTVLITLGGYARTATSTDDFFYSVISCSGMVVCYIWYRLIKSYKNINSAKFKVIHEIEKELPLKVYDAEWEAVGRGKDKKLYQPFTHMELKVPWVFFAIHSLILLYLFPWGNVLKSCV